MLNFKQKIKLFEIFGSNYILNNIPVIDNIDLDIIFKKLIRVIELKLEITNKYSADNLPHYSCSIKFLMFDINNKPSFYNIVKPIYGETITDAVLNAIAEKKSIDEMIDEYNI